MFIYQGVFSVEHYLECSKTWTRIQTLESESELKLILGTVVTVVDVIVCLMLQHCLVLMLWLCLAQGSLVCISVCLCTFVPSSSLHPLTRGFVEKLYFFWSFSTFTYLSVWKSPPRFDAFTLSVFCCSSSIGQTYPRRRSLWCFILCLLFSISAAGLIVSVNRYKCSLLSRFSLALSLQLLVPDMSSSQYLIFSAGGDVV